MTITDPNELWGEIYISLVAIAAFSGHLYPVYMKFKDGGKGVATAGRCFVVILPTACVVAILVFILFICLFNRASAASLAAALPCPLLFGMLPVPVS